MPTLMKSRSLEKPQMFGTRIFVPVELREQMVELLNQQGAHVPGGPPASIDGTCAFLPCLVAKR
jgi:hypothetical protein